MIKSRMDILKALANDETAKQEFSYSAIMRKLRKEHPTKVIGFMKEFKRAFDIAHERGLDGGEQVALMQAVKMVGL